MSRRSGAFVVVVALLGLVVGGLLMWLDKQDRVHDFRVEFGATHPRSAKDDPELREKVVARLAEVSDRYYQALADERRVVRDSLASRVSSVPGGADFLALHQAAWERLNQAAKRFKHVCRLMWPAYTVEARAFCPPPGSIS